MNATHYLACDLGAESGRVMLGTLRDNRLSVEEVHRFATGPTTINGSLRWDVLRIFDEVKTGLAKAAKRNIPIAGLSCDSWGVDYVLVRSDEPVLSAPFHYRDTRTDGVMDSAFAVVPADEIYGETGVQFMSFNTLYQLLSDSRLRPDLLAVASHFLLIGDYFNFLFSGVARAEDSLASTTQLFRPADRRWSSKLIDRFHLPAGMFPPVVSSGTVLGCLSPGLAAEVGLAGVSVVAGCSHDTGAAVAAVPAEGTDWGYLSSGTWSLLGVECPEPLITGTSMKLGFTNEVGYGGTIRFLKNIIGLWVVQECRRTWVREGADYTYEALVSMAGGAAPFRSFIDPADPRFGKPGDMPARIREYCIETGQKPPSTPGETIRCVLESLALLYRHTMTMLEEATGRRLNMLHIVGGGSRNAFLNQCTADATGRTVVAGPDECTAIGNILVQSIGLGHTPSLAAARKIVRDSVSLTRFVPADTRTWDRMYEKFLTMRRSLSHKEGSP
jgi:rhamnulokinase